MIIIGILKRREAWVYGVLGITFLLLYPVFYWYGRRMLDGGDEPLGLFALVLALGFGILRGLPKRIGIWRLIGASICLGVVVLGSLPPLLNGVLAVSVFSFLLVHGRGWLALFGLACLSLPLVTSMQFYLGYPLRLVLGLLCSLVLNILGFAVDAQGVVLRWRGELVVIDAPCSGVQMIWTVAVFSTALACWFKLNNRSVLSLLRWAGFWVFLGNVIRNVVLFFVESGIVGGPSWGHDGVGIALFVAILGIVYWKAERLKESEVLEPSIASFPQKLGIGPYASLVYVGFCMIVFCIQLSRSSDAELENAIVTDKQNLSWKHWDPSWEQVTLTPFEARYAKTFPGRIACFRDGNEGIVVREIDRATRMLHPAKDCYQALGFGVTPLPIMKRVDGTFWGQSRAFKEDTNLVIQERIVSSDGQTWTDISSWYWSALLGNSEGPWVSITMVNQEV